MANEAKTAETVFKIAGYGVLFYFGYKAVSSISDMFGFTKSADQKAVDEQVQNANVDSTQIQDQNNPFAAFNPNYAPAIVSAWMKKNPGKKWNTALQAKFTQQQYKDMSDRIANAPGIFNDNEDVVYDVFRTLQTQWQLSLFSSFFHTFYKKDLLLFLKGFLSASELNDILNIIKPYPQYFR